MSFLFSVVRVLFELVRWAIMIRVLISWLPGLDFRNPFVRLLDDLTEPILAPIRGILPQTGGIDFSPLVAFLLLSVVERLILTLLVQLVF
ncbi:MAG: YggT family protein [Chitinophagales bacterium]